MLKQVPDWVVVVLLLIGNLAGLYVPILNTVFLLVVIRSFFRASARSLLLAGSVCAVVSFSGGVIYGELGPIHTNGQPNSLR
ncbi:MAG: hypothetical protein IPM23_15540 [Candidatus Melainabacteria bacterium]|nr:hypothetical protein [Candidatus Melainabacteria bacterium]